MMAQYYSPQGSYRDIQVLSPKSVIDVEVLTGLSIPDNIYFEVPIPMESYKAGYGPTIMDMTARGLQELSNMLNVASVWWTESLDASGLIAAFAIAKVQIPTPAGKSGTFSTEVEFDIGVMGTDPAIFNAVVVPQLEAATAQLEAAAAA